MSTVTRLKERMRQAVPLSIERQLRERTEFDALKANVMARQAKRVDLVANQMAQMLQLADRKSIDGADCLEIGSGWVLSHAVVCHLLGAKSVVATDLYPVAQLGAIKTAVRAAIAPAVRDALAPFSDHTEVRNRFDHLVGIDTFDLKTLADLGIEYRPNVNLAQNPTDERFDFIYSMSVLEHVPVADCAPLIANMFTSLRPGGSMLHCIHLEDHLNLNDPFKFLALDQSTYTDSQANERGNRLRASEWRQIFLDATGQPATVMYEWQRNNVELPTLSGPLQSLAEPDLRTSHLGLATTAR